MNWILVTFALFSSGAELPTHTAAMTSEAACYRAAYEAQLTSPVLAAGQTGVRYVCAWSKK